MDMILIGGGFGLIGYLAGRFLRWLWLFVVLPFLILLTVLMVIASVIGGVSPSGFITSAWEVIYYLMYGSAEVVGAWVLSAAWLAIPFFTGAAWAVMRGK
ncbi:hypothetical protein VSS37_03240 [Candidatus Thiothrix sp. Deng01]|uniref:Phage holin family protein n=1 Tax=Candidatus Thiothrix phosphatis TaxID=3112415 RepID=A0ABU6CV25_9GAMM|nr:hypothetical protein [Candidatus Thiothrix sp. Deng01]MEB4589984.1 hypothetical protein [Candidatus Thiothrix sp. Deng01]